VTPGGPLGGRVALVAGGSGRLGAEVARGLAAAGAAVAVHYRGNRAAAQDAAAACAHGVALGADVTDAAAVDGLYAAAQRALGAPVTVLVNAADPGGHEAAPVAELAPEELDRHLSGVRAHHLLCARGIPAMRAAGFGRIVFVSGALMARPAGGLSAYGSAKAAASTLTRYVALEEGRHGITANVVAPGRIVAPDEPEPSEPHLRALADRLLERMALQRFPTYAEVAETIGALTLPSLSPVTGQTLWVTGGEPIAS
jgi:NAD(P)-dependent dehydrogenase (short-subunit alcohol dehydrogenase family)